ncbi:LysE family transporter [Microbulbifer sp. SH-1]|uniref:LysE family translocator n=1 Tax=Microbulbifer sp. SH-1 TaxID=2681547 RepID=UPI001409A2D2|nr:LysE family translocator [Microbulbifer sp. SH-1]QIL90537.1 LysE family transporter [Microbulbifer sp. SH-1]
MTLISALALFGTMVVLAVIPGPGVLAVVARSVSGGVLHGVLTSVGIVLGDYVFIALCLSGLAYIADAMGSAFVVLKFLGAAYLVWMGFSLICARRKTNTQPATEIQSSRYGSLLLGLTTTLGNPKAILFYLSFFPAFLPMHDIGVMDAVTILVVTALAVGGVMLIYVWITVRAKKILQNKPENRSLNLFGGSILIASGVWMAVRSS